MCPQVVGFDLKNLEITEELFVIMGNLLQSIMRKNNISLLHLLKCELLIYVEKHIYDFVVLDNIIYGKKNFTELKQYVRGLNFLDRCNILNQLDKVYNTYT